MNTKQTRSQILRKLQLRDGTLSFVRYNNVVRANMFYNDGTILSKIIRKI